MWRTVANSEMLRGGTMRTRVCLSFLNAAARWESAFDPKQASSRLTELQK